MEDCKALLTYLLTYLLLLAYLLAFSSRGDAGGEGPEVRCELLDPPLRLSGMLSDQGVWLHLLWLSVYYGSAYYGAFTMAALTVAPY